MFRRLRLLYRRYRNAHTDIEAPGGPIRNSADEIVGYVERVRLCQGRLKVSGWAVGARVRLVLAGCEAETVPAIRREDVRNALGLPETVGFEIELPATPDMLSSAAPPGLIVTPLPEQARIIPIHLPVRAPLRARAVLGLSFLRDVSLAAPAAIGWMFTSSPILRARIKARLRLDLPNARGALDARLVPDETALATTSGAAPGYRPHIDIILPVYNAFDLLCDCLDRIERNTDLPWRLIVIEDGSTDARVRPFLRDWAAGRAQVALLENPQNMGFIASVNRGLARALEGGAGPVVLLNSDALVPEGWASRLVHPFRDAPDVASVTPMSNDAEIFSVPAICCRTVLLPGQGDAIDHVARCIGADAAAVEAPTGVGFCMAMARDWLARVPMLDTAFGRGYGEEVDWCRKTAALGGRHLGTARLFVEHRGGESFGSAEKLALVAKNNRIVSRRYPDYDQRVQDFILSDPLLTARLALGLAWAGSLAPSRAVPVYLAHSMGGGADHWLEHHMAEALEAGRPSVVLRVGGARRWQLELVAPWGRITGQSDDAALIRTLLAILPRREVVYSCGVGDRDPMEIPEMLAALAQDGECATILFHDYFPLSPSYTLLDSDGAYRGPVRAPRADGAHIAQRPGGRRVALNDWQDAWHAFARRADLVAFSQSSAAEVAAVWPDLRAQIAVRPHRLRHAVARLAAPARDAAPVLAVLGNIGKQKGAGLVQSLARARAQGRDGPKLVLVGNIDPNYSLADTITVHGSYQVQDLPHLVRHYGITHWLIPSIWPETFCYTVHEALATGLPVFAFGLGAQGDAVRAAENGIEMPFDPDADLARVVREQFDAYQAMEKETTC